MKIAAIAPRSFFQRMFFGLTILFVCTGFLRAEEIPKVTADKERVIRTVRFLSEENFPITTKEDLEKRTNYLIKAVSEAGLEVTRDEFRVEAFSRHTFANLHALKKGKTDKRIVIGAHYDTIAETPGADDNASGIATIIELTHMLKNVTELNCDIEFVFYDAEEIGLLGSRFHAKKLKDQKVDVACMLCLDLVGYYSDEENSQRYPVRGMSLLYGTKGDFLAMIGRAQDAALITDAHKAFQEATTLRLLSLPAPQGLDLLLSRSDHAPFWWEGYPALFFTDTADYRNKNYHKATDTWDTLDYDRLTQVPLGIYHVILTIDTAHAPN